MPVYGFDRETAMRLKKQAKLTSTGGVGGKATLLEKSSTTPFFLFTLAANMGVSDALAEIRTMDDATQIEASFPVVNTLGDFTHLQSGDRGVCVRVYDTYYAVHPEEPGGGGSGVTAGHVFTLTSDLAATVSATANATVLITGEAGVSIGNTITVYNTGTKLGKIGAVGWAVKIGSQYWVTEINQYPILSLVTLSSGTHSFSGGNTRVGQASQQQTITTSSWVSSTPYPFSFLPSPRPAINNPCNLMALSGDKGLVTYNANSATFDLIEVFPANKRRVVFRLTGNMPSTTIASTTAFEILETREYTAGEVPAPSSIADPMHLIIGGRTGEEGVIEYSYRDSAWHVVSFERKPVEMRVDGLNFQISHDGGVTWTTWASGATCP